MLPLALGGKPWQRRWKAYHSSAFPARTDPCYNRSSHSATRSAPVCVTLKQSSAPGAAPAKRRISPARGRPALYFGRDAASLHRFGLLAISSGLRAAFTRSGRSVKRRISLYLVAIIADAGRGSSELLPLRG